MQTMALSNHRKNVVFLIPVIKERLYADLMMDFERYLCGRFQGVTRFDRAAFGCWLAPPEMGGKVCQDLNSLWWVGLHENDLETLQRALQNIARLIGEMHIFYAVIGVAHLTPPEEPGLAIAA